jgi:hypothetical protein
MREGAEVPDLVQRYAATRPRWVLYEFTVSGALKPIDKWETPEDPADLIDAIEARAKRYASFAGGGQAIAFELQVVEVIDGEDRIAATEQWRCSPEILPGGHSLTELPNEAGLVSAAMRHAEGFFRASMVGMRAQGQAQADLIERMSKALDRAQSINMRAYAALEAASSGQHMRDLEIRRFESDAKRKDQLGEKIGNMLPLVGHAITKRLQPSATTASAAILARSLFESLRPEQLDAILSQLDGEQRAQVLTFYRELVEERERHEAQTPDKPKPPAEGTH